MRKIYKEKRLEKIIPIINNKIDEDITTAGCIKGHTLDIWLCFINTNLCPQERVHNNNALISIFKKLTNKFILKTETKSLCCEGYKLVKTFYKLEPNGHRM